MRVCKVFIVIWIIFTLANCALGDTAAVVRTSDSSLNASLTEDLTKAGYTVSEIDMLDLCDNTRIGADKINLLVLPDSSSLPLQSTGPIASFLRGGGDIIALNAPLWQHILINDGSNWIPIENYGREHAGDVPGHIFIDFSPSSIADWHRSSNAMDHDAVYETVSDGPVQGYPALHAKISDMTSYDSLYSPDIEKPFPADHTLTVFSAKGSADTRQLSVEWDEKDGSRWIAVFPLSTEWRQYVLAPSSFKFWRSNPKRGFSGDMLHPENAIRFSVGLSYTHTGGGRRHEYWIGPIGTAPAQGVLKELAQSASIPVFDTLSPSYKFFQTQDASVISIADNNQSIDVAANSIINCPHPRPDGAGFDKDRSWRWIPLMEAKSPRDQWRGNPAALTIHDSGDFAGGAWASFGLKNTGLYKKPAIRDEITRTAAKIRDGVFLMDGGANFYTYFDDQDINLGARVVNLSKQKRDGITTRVILRNADTGQSVFSHDWQLAFEPGCTKSVSTAWHPTNWPVNGFITIAELLRDGKTIDRVQHEVHVWKPNKVKNFVTIKNGDFYLKGKRWIVNGVNYMPSSGIGVEDGKYFEHWLGKKSYDPAIIERDIQHIVDMGLNSVSIFIYEPYAKDQNLLDLLRRLEIHGLKANLSLRPGTPMQLRPNVITNIIKYYRLWENDTVFAYDLAWEPSFGSHDERKIWDRDWENWIIERYGSIANAEHDWGFSIPRENGVITNPTPEQIDTDGKWRVMSAAYRRFLDTLLYKKYGAARDLVRSLDQNHFVSFRMAEAANPTYRWDGRITYDFPGLAGAVDFLGPEAYGRIGDWDRIKPGWFQFEYARWAAPNKPMIWPEMGTTIWDTSRMQDDPVRLEFQKQYFNDFYRMLISSGTDGIFFWWYPGGFRTYENSDFGIINPDGTDRPVTQAIRSMSQHYIDSNSTQPDKWITIDRDAYPNGVTGIYSAIQSEFWNIIESGHIPGLRTKGTGTTSADCPLIAVGNTPHTDSNPPKYLEAVFDSIEILGADGRWVRVDKNGSIGIDMSKPIYARVRFINLGEAALLARKNSLKTGYVVITAACGGKVASTQLKHDIQHLDSAVLDKVKLPYISANNPVEVTISFKAIGRTQFGEKFSFILKQESR